MSSYNISIRGIIESDIPHEEFLNIFIKWVEDNDFRFCGASREVNDEDSDLGELKFTDVL